MSVTTTKIEESYNNATSDRQRKDVQDQLWASVKKIDAGIKGHPTSCWCHDGIGCE
jgi:hypothetical protein